ncbi:hypothetical protein Tco_0656626 [Tanacetum coccineum]|uniref:Uncharacterized protein n=1 Tax=Tanacetum coccineum TaxID=301880 RepID=A0ABQ4XAJ6_9ASTR
MFLSWLTIIIVLPYSLHIVSIKGEGYGKNEVMKEEVIASSNDLSRSIGSYRIHVLGDSCPSYGSPTSLASMGGSLRAGKTALLWAQEAKGMSSAASPPNFLPFLRARSACASRAIGALLSSYSSLDGSDGLRRSFPTKIEKAVSHRDVDSFSAPNEMGNLSLPI